MVFHKDAPENEKLVLKRSILGLGRVMYVDVARMLEQIKSCLRERERERYGRINRHLKITHLQLVTNRQRTCRQDDMTIGQDEFTAALVKSNFSVFKKKKKKKKIRPVNQDGYNRASHRHEIYCKTKTNKQRKQRERKSLSWFLFLFLFLYILFIWLIYMYASV